MCGIAGAIWWDSEKAVDPETLRRMTHSIRHRGPDADGHFESPLTPESSRCGVALGHRRLSIIDVDGSAQPLSNEDGRVQLIFNGEIYNYRELRPKLQAAGHVFRTDGDTEVIVHLYEEFGLDFVSHLRGMFVLAIWDESRQRLVIARDRLGQKPLHYRLEAGRLAFASELKALLQIPGISRSLNHQSVLRYMMLQYVPHPHSILQGFQKLPPASIGVLEDQQFTVSSYWSPPFDQPELHRQRIDDWKEELRSTLTEAVRLRLRSDVPLGAFLSGGVDSTIISGVMQSLLDRPVRTFSIGFPVPEFDERSYARSAAEFLGTEHHDEVVHPDALETLPQLIWHYDEPFGDSSAIPTMYLSRITRNHVTVALTGDAGDELFCGYDRYRAVRIAGRLDYAPRWFKQFCSHAVRYLPTSVRQKSFRRRLKRLFEVLAQEPEDRYLNWITIFNRARLEALVSEELWQQTQPSDPADCIASAYELCPNRDFITRTTATDVQTYLPCDILTKVDIATMSVGLEGRSPFLDHHVVELAARMPIEVKQTSAGGKRVLIESFSDVLPEEIQKRRKMGFGVPIDHWFRDELKPLLHDILLSDRCLDRGLLNAEFVRQLVSEHTSGAMDHAYRLWNLLCLELWQRIYLDERPPLNAPVTLP